MSAQTQQHTAHACRRPAMATMDYRRGLFGGNGSLVVNRVCLTCGTHWHGQTGDVTEYSRQAWDVLMDSALESERTVCISAGRNCANCAHARSDLAGLNCGLIAEQRSSVARNVGVDPSDCCDQHDYATGAHA